MAHAQSIPPLGELPLPPTVNPPVALPAKPSLENRSDGSLSSTQNPDQPSVPSAADVAAVNSATKVFSFGTSDYSILFLPTQVQRMKQEISAYESTGKSTALSVVVPDRNVAAVVEEKIVEPDTYPVFFLSSIVYETPNDWSIWMGGEKITSRKNDTEVTVLEVTRDSATFQWKPSYKIAITQRRDGEKFASVDLVNNKLATNQRVSYNSQAGAITFTLRQNQTFAAGYFKIFEGFVPSPKLEAISFVAKSDNNAMTLIDTPRPFPMNSSYQSTPSDLMRGPPNMQPIGSPAPPAVSVSKMPPRM